MKRNKRAIILLLLLASTLACTKGPNTNPVISDPLRFASIQVARLTDAVNAATKTSIALEADKLISPDQHRQLLLLLQRVNGGVLVLSRRLSGLTVLDAGAKLNLLAAVNEISAALAEPQTLALFNIVNPKSKAKVQATIDTIVAVVSVLKKQLGGA